MTREEFNMIIMIMVTTNESSKDMKKEEFREALDDLVDYLSGKADAIRSIVKTEKEGIGRPY
jgi:hypothetical protein